MRARTLFKLLSVRRETLKMNEQEKGFLYDKTEYRLPQNIYTYILKQRSFTVNTIYYGTERRKMRIGGGDVSSLLNYRNAVV